MFAVRRMRRRAAVFAGLVVVAALTTAMAAVITGVLADSAVTGVRASLRGNPGSGLALRAELPLAHDANAQDETVRRVLADGFGAAPTTVIRSVETTVLPVPGRQARLRVASVADLSAAATLVAGQWPDPADTAAASLQADAAAQLGVSPGDTVTVDGTPFTVAATWRVADEEAPRWLGDEVWLTGTDGSATGPLVVSEAAWASLDVQPRARWTIVPDIARLQPGDLGLISRAWRGLPAAMEAAGLDTPTQTGRFLLAADGVAARLQALAAIGPAAGTIVAAVALLALWALVGLLADARSGETLLLRARGLTTPRLARAAAVESGIIALVGGLLAGAAAVGALTLYAESQAVVAAGIAAAATAIGIALAAAVFAAARTAGVVRDRTLSDGARRLAGIGGAVLLAAGATLSALQLVRYGAAGEDAGSSVDPVSVIAPALLLAAVVFAGAVAFPWAARAGARVSARRRGPRLAVRAVARRVASAAVPIVLVGIALGQLALAAGYSASWRTGFDQSQALATGTPLRLTAFGLTDGQLAAAAAVPGVQSVVPVRTSDVKAGGVPASVLAVTPQAFGALASTAQGLIDPPAAAAAIEAGHGIPALPAGATTITVSIEGGPALPSVWLMDDAGRVVRLDLALQGASGSAAVPAGTWRLLAIDLAVGEQNVQPDAQGNLPDDAGIAVRVTAVTTDAGPIDLNGYQWQISGLNEQGLYPFDPNSRPATKVFPGFEAARFVPTAPTPTVVLSRALADELGVGVGDPLIVSTDVSDGGLTVTATIGAVVAAIPGIGAGPAVLVDPSVIVGDQLTSRVDPREPSVAWIATPDVPGTATALRAALPLDVSISAPTLDPDLRMLLAAPIVMWVAAAGCVLLALAGLIAATAVQVRGRRAETAVLAALGMSARAQSRSRRTELVVVIGWGALVGLAAGATAVLVVVATLARSAVPDVDPSLPTAVRFDAGAFGLAAAAFAVGAGLVIVGYGLATARAVRRTGAPGAARVS